jgi:hypothetical protein
MYGDELAEKRMKWKIIEMGDENGKIVVQLLLITFACPKSFL